MYYSREICQVEKEISKPVSSTSKKKIGHNPVSADEFTSLSARIDSLESHFSDFEKRVDSKFNLIVKKLDNQRSNNNNKNKYRQKGIQITIQINRIHSRKRNKILSSKIKMNSQELTTSVVGKTEVGDLTAQSDPFLDRLVGSSNQHNIMVNGIKFTCMKTHDQWSQQQQLVSF